MLFTTAVLPGLESEMSKRQSQAVKSSRDWQEHIRVAQERGISLAQYCRERSLSVQSLYTARYEQAKQTRRSGGARATARSSRKFVEVRVAPVEAAAKSPMYRVRVKGCEIECATLPPTAWLKSLITGDSDAVS
jgi:hypothetical protein